MSKLQEEVSHEMLVLMLPRVSSRVSGFPVASPCLWGKLPFRRCQSRLSCRFAWQAWHFVTFRRVLYTCRKSFCVAGAILLRRFQKGELQFSWQAQHFGRVHHHFAWQAQHFRRVVLRVFCELAMSGLRQVATRCKFHRRGIL